MLKLYGIFGETTTGLSINLCDSDTGEGPSGSVWRFDGWRCNGRRVDPTVVQVGGETEGEQISMGARLFKCRSPSLLWNAR
jgi:hypothetical protein